LLQGGWDGIGWYWMGDYMRFDGIGWYWMGDYIKFDEIGCDWMESDGR